MRILSGRRRKSSLTTYFTFREKLLRGKIKVGLHSYTHGPIVCSRRIDPAGPCREGQKSSKRGANSRRGKGHGGSGRAASGAAEAGE